MVLLKMGPGPRGLGPNPFSTVSQNIFLFFWILGVPKNKNEFFKEIGCIFEIFAILANGDLNLKLKICKVVI